MAVSFWAYRPPSTAPFCSTIPRFPSRCRDSRTRLSVWIRGVRPALMFTYWVNAAISRDDPYSYHLLNVVFHWIASGLVFLIVRRMTGMGRRPMRRGAICWPVLPPRCSCCTRCRPKP